MIEVALNKQLLKEECHKSFSNKEHIIMFFLKV